MIASKSLAISLLLLVFILGVATGGLVVPLVIKHVPSPVSAQNLPPSPKKLSRVESLSQELRLRPEQTAALQVIVDKSRDRYRELNKEYSPYCDEIRNQTRAAIMQILSDEQKQLFEKRIERERLERETKSAQEHD